MLSKPNKIHGQPFEMDWLDCEVRRSTLVFSTEFPLSNLSFTFWACQVPKRSFRCIFEELINGDIEWLSQQE